jgi:hypothetical protein
MTTTTDRVLDVFRDMDPVTPQQLADATHLDLADVRAALAALTDRRDIFHLEIYGLTPARRAALRQSREGRTVHVTGRRGKGVLEAEILAFLRTRPGVDLGPIEVSRGVGAKSGAVYPAMKRLAEQGDLVQTVDKPVRYRTAR